MADDEIAGAPGPDVARDPETAEIPPAATAPAASTAVVKTRWRDRSWTFGAMIAVALAALVIGVVAGGVAGAVAGGHHDHGRHSRMGPWGPGNQLPPGWRKHGPRDFGGNGGPGWRWNDGPQQAPGMTPYGGATPSAPAAPSPAPPGATG